MSLAQAPTPDLDHAQLAAILRWYADMGVDIAVDEEPRNRFLEAPKQAQAPQAAEPARRAAPPRTPDTFSAGPARGVDAAAALTVEAAIQSARECAGRAGTLEALRDELSAFEGCILKRTATSFVFAEGDPKARIMFVGDAPGDDDDRMGQAFIGKPGRLMDRMLKSIRLERENVWLTNLLPWRIPGRRSATPQEIAVCLPFLMRQIELIQPAVLVCLGNEPALTLMDIKGGVVRGRGVWKELRLEGVGAPIRAIATFAPSYMLRVVSSKRDAWRDLIEIRKALDSLA